MGTALERVLSIGPALANRAGIVEPVLDLIARDMLRFGSQDRGFAGMRVVTISAAPPVSDLPASDLPARLLAYVVDGDAPQTLAQIQAAGGYAIGGYDQDGKARGVRWQIYDRWEELPLAVLLRFARVLAADSAAVAGHAALDLSKQHPWVETLVRDLVGLPISHCLYSETSCLPHGKASIERLGVLLDADGLTVAAFLHSAFTSRLGSTCADQADFVTALRGFGAALAQHKPALAPLFRDPAFPQRLRALSLLSRAGAEAHVAFADELVDLAIDASRQIRDAAWPLARKLGAHAGPRSRQRAVEAAPERRALALRLLWEADLPGDRAFVRERGQADKAESVRKAVAGLVSAADGAADRQTAEGEHVAGLQVPEVAIDVTAPTSPEARELLRAWLATADAAVTAMQRRFLSIGQQCVPTPLSDLVEKIVARVDGETTAPAGVHAESRFWVLWNNEREAQHRNIMRWLAAPGVQLIHLVRLLRMTGQIEPRDGRDWRVHYPAELALRKFIGDLRRGSLLEFARACETEGIPVSTVISHWYRPHGWLTCGWPDDAVWPFFAAFPDALDPGFDTSSPYAKEWDFDLLRAFDALATFPVLPPGRVAAIVEAALGTSKQVRASAQRALDRHPGRLAFAKDGLTGSRSEARIAATQWLTRLKDPEAIEPLEAAFKREKNDAVQGAILTALETLGAPIDRYLNVKGLAKAAEAGLKKGIPRDLAWFPFDQLPRVRWQAKDEPVGGDILRWLLVQSCRLKMPEPGTLLRRYCAMFRAEDREALGAFVLSAWIAQDLKPPSREAAEQQAQRWLGLNSQNMDELVTHFLQRPGGSAIGSKGVLAFAAACGRAQIAPIVQQYLKEWYGNRAGQGKALIQMLAWVEHPAAIQLMLSVGSRFRTKSFQEEASRQAQLLAERKGWTLDELADRTIPTAGFDENGTLEFDYGARTFLARLREDMTIGLETADGKPVGALPDARKDDDEAKVKEAKKRLSAARKELKGVLTQQKDRLYEAMCTGRTWQYGDFSAFLLQHPIVRRHCQRLVWRTLENSKSACSFRPLDDGTLTDAEDNRAALPPDCTVSLAHDTNCDAAVCEAWLKHFQDYGLVPLFQQFGRGSYVLPADRREATALAGFEGHMIDAFKLRTAAGKLGYMRGATGDGGWFYDYTKSFGSLGMEAVMGFSGSGLPEENRKVALMNLSFRRSRGADVPLGEVPAVILSECLNDMRTVAAEGSGFDPDWQSKVER
jgi:Domain of unknown function (DUF4132)